MKLKSPLHFFYSEININVIDHDYYYQQEENYQCSKHIVNWGCTIA